MERVYVANLPPDIRIKDIDDFFRPFGKVIYIDVNHRANPVYAYVQFESPRNAFNAVKARHGYNYEGYTLQLRLVENEVRKCRDSTPPPPPPLLSMLNNSYEGHNINNGLNNNYSSNRMVQNSQWSGNNHSNIEQFSTNNCNNIRQQYMDYSTSNRSNIQQLSMMPYSSGSLQNNMEQQFSNIGHLNMQEQYSNFNRSNIQQQYSGGRSNMPQLNNFDNRLGTTQQNMAPYSFSGPSSMQQQLPNTSRAGIPQLQNMNIQNPNNASWGETNNNKGWNTGNFGNDNFGSNFNNSYGNVGTNATYNPNNDSYAKQGLEDKYTIGLSGAGRKWFNRYISKGFSPEAARAKALEHRKLPYLRGDPKSKPIPNDPTNAALETIGNTIISILSSNPGDIQPAAPQVNAVSRRQYLKSLDTLKIIKGRRIKSGKDRISIKYHTQIVRDYQKLNQVSSSNDSITSKNTTSKSTTARNETPQKSNGSVSSTRTETRISELMIKQKAKLLKRAKELGSEMRNKKRLGGAYKKRTKILMDHGFLEMEAKSLAWNPLDELEELLSLKREYDLLAKKTVFIPASKASLSNAPKSVVYRNDLQYLEEYAKHRIKGLSKTILFGLTECLKRIHDYEKGKHLPLTENKFTKLLIKITSREGFFKNINKTSSLKKKTEKSTADKKDVKESNKSELKKEVEKVENQDDGNVTEDTQVREENQDDENQQYNEEDQDSQQDPGNEEYQDNGEFDGSEEHFEGNDQYEIAEDRNAGE